MTDAQWYSQDNKYLIVYARSDINDEHFASDLFFFLKLKLGVYYSHATSIDFLSKLQAFRTF